MTELGRLLWIVDAHALTRAEDPIAVVAAGVEFVHLRDESVRPRRWQQLGRGWSAHHPQLRLVVNRGPEWAAEVGWGAHLKASQPAVDASTRARFRLLGRSVHDLAELHCALQDRPDYLVAGPVFPTRSKPGHLGIGLDRLRSLVEAAAGCAVFAIGGVDPQRVGDLLDLGVHGVAVRSGISAAPGMAAAARRFLAVLPADASQP